MKASKVAAVVTALLASDAKPTEAQILAAIIAADKKGKDSGGGLGPVEIQDKPKAKDKAKDEFPPKDKAEDAEKDDPESTNDEDPEMSEDEDKDDEKAKDDIQPVKSATGNSGAGGKEPAKDKAKDAKGMDTAQAVKVALDARDALHAARRDVETVLGVVAYDSAAEVYGAALKKLGVDTAGVHTSAFRSLFKMARDKAEATAPVLASDAATVKGMAAVIKGYNRLP